MNRRASARRRMLWLGIVVFLATCSPATTARDSQLDGRAVEEPAMLSVDPACRLPPAAEVIVNPDGSLLATWSFRLEPVHARHVLPADTAFASYRALIDADRAYQRHPALFVPPARDSTETGIWRDETFNNQLVYERGVGAIRPITCLDALLFAYHNARVRQADRQTEFIASILRRSSGGGEEVRVVFGAGSETFPPRSVYGFERVDRYRAQGWRYWYLLHNHTRQADGALGVPAPSTSDVRFARSLATERGLERIRVTNGFYTFDAAVEEIAQLRGR